jgi:hypothetical protein
LAREVIVAVVIVLAALGGLLMGVAAIVRWVLDRQRLAAWEADWYSTEPRWARRSEL